MELIDITACLIESAIGFVVSWLLLSKKKQNILSLITVIIVGTAAKFLFYRVSASAGYLLSVSITFIGNMILSSEKLSKKFAISMTATYIICMSDFIFGCLIAIISTKGFKQLRLEWLIIKVLCTAAFIPVYLFLRRIPKNSPNKFYSFFAETMSGFFIVAVVVTGAFRGSAMNTSKENMIVAVVVALLFYGASIIVTSFFSKLCIGLDQEQKMHLLETNFKYLNEQIDIRKENERALRNFRHDIMNYLINIRSLIATNQTNSALKLLEETVGKAELPSPKLITTGNVFADAVISSKSSICMRKKIRFEFKSVSLKKYRIEAADISSLLSNLLDNAIEATEKASEPQVWLNIFEHNAYIVIQVENSILEDVKSNDLQLKSTKVNSALHGCGTEIIREIAGKYNGNTIWKSDNKCFTATVLIKK